VLAAFFTGAFDWDFDDFWRLWAPQLIRAVLGVGCLMLAALAGDEAVVRGARPLPSYALAVFAGAALACGLHLPAVMLFGVEPFGSLGFLVRFDMLLHLFYDDALYGAVGCFVYVNRRSERQARERTHAAEVAREWARRRTLESQLQAMQARVEPQFLFNTLAQVRELYDRDEGIASRMLDDLIAYLRAALPHLRGSSSTLGQEVELARAYLDIVRVRLGERLQVEIDVPEQTKRARLPPMLLLPLVDHALVYGLRPADSHGAIRIETRASAGRLTLCITDSGAGFVPDGDGEKLACLGERLRALYGESARFELQRMQQCAATRATLEIPYENASDGGDR
jgi:hypothetical protein